MVVVECFSVPLACFILLFFSSSRSCCLVRLHTPYSTMTENLLHLRGTLKAHGDWVTSIATTPESPDMIISGSRGTCSR